MTVDDLLDDVEAMIDALDDAGEHASAFDRDDVRDALNEMRAAAGRLLRDMQGAQRPVLPVVDRLPARDATGGGLSNGQRRTLFEVQRCRDAVDAFAAARLDLTPWVVEENQMRPGYVAKAKLHKQSKDRLAYKLHLTAFSGGLENLGRALGRANATVLNPADLREPGSPTQRRAA